MIYATLNQIITFNYTYKTKIHVVIVQSLFWSLLIAQTARRKCNKNDNSGVNNTKNLIIASSVNSKSYSLKINISVYPCGLLHIILNLIRLVTRKGHSM